MSKNKEVRLFEEAFYNWLLDTKSIDIATFESDRFSSTLPKELLCKIEMHKLKSAIERLIQAKLTGDN